MVAAEEAKEDPAGVIRRFYTRLFISVSNIIVRMETKWKKTKMYNLTFPKSHK